MHLCGKERKRRRDVEFKLLVKEEEGKYPQQHNHLSKYFSRMEISFQYIQHCKILVFYSAVCGIG